MMIPKDRIPVTLLTGYLGSGKTTLLNGLLRQPGQPRTLVLINEYGDIPVDNDLVVFSPDSAVVETLTGCLCCAVRGDLAKTLRSAPQRFARNGKPWFERVVIETTGIADPAPVLATLLDDTLIATRYRLERTLVAVDAVNGLSTLAREPEAGRQLAIADQVVLTKADLASDEDLESLRRRVDSINPVPVFVARYGALTEPEWCRLLAPVADVRLQPLKWLSPGTSQAFDKLQQAKRGVEGTVPRWRVALCPGRHAARLGNLGRDFRAGQHSAVAGLGALAELHLDQLYLRVACRLGKARLVETAIGIATAEVA
ncbi:MAG: GTP-binding protein [Gammaproteobacteria bacterium]|nr:GTP-binding protein [Gammaproteobacteria bacterium]